MRGHAQVGEHSVQFCACKHAVMNRLKDIIADETEIAMHQRKARIINFVVYKSVAVTIEGDDVTVFV